MNGLRATFLGALAGLVVSTGGASAAATLNTNERNVGYCWVVLTDDKYHDDGKDYSLEAVFLINVLARAVKMTPADLIDAHLVRIKGEVDNDLATHNTTQFTAADCADYAHELMKVK